MRLTEGQVTGLIVVGSIIAWIYTIFAMTMYSYDKAKDRDIERVKAGMVSCVIHGTGYREWTADPSLCVR